MTSVEYDSARPPYGRALAEWVCVQSGVREFDHALDVGCGTGRSTRWARFFSRRVTGVDKSAAMISLARRLNTDPAVTFVPASAEDLGQLGGQIDIIVIAGAFEWFDKARFIGEARSLMPDGGPVAILWSWLEPLEPVSHRWYWLMRQILGAQIGPEPNDALAMVAAVFPRRQSWTRIRTQHRYTAAGLHAFLRSSSYWRPESVEMVTHSQQLVERFVIENSQATTDVQLTFREVGFLGYVER
jgi:ubiquinone/menaquinone biosynthesis C-methylase UbiE